jgi:hypothetical protein
VNAVGYLVNWVRYSVAFTLLSSLVNFGLGADPSHWRFATTLVPGLLLGLACYGFASSTGLRGGHGPVARRTEPV